MFRGPEKVYDKTLTDRVGLCAKGREFMGQMFALRTILRKCLEMK